VLRGNNTRAYIAIGITDGLEWYAVRGIRGRGGLEHRMSRLCQGSLAVALTSAWIPPCRNCAAAKGVWSSPFSPGKNRDRFNANAHFNQSENHNSYDHCRRRTSVCGPRRVKSLTTGRCSAWRSAVGMTRHLRLLCHGVSLRRPRQSVVRLAASSVAISRPTYYDLSHPCRDFPGASALEGCWALALGVRGPGPPAGGGSGGG
jgi:hypothetical protein